MDYQEYAQTRKEQAEKFKALLSEVATTVLPGYIPGDPAQENDLSFGLAAVVYKMFDDSQTATLFMLKAFSEYLAYACNWTASEEFETIRKRVDMGESLTDVLRGK